MTDTPEIPQKKSIPLEMEPGTYYWCSCGRSKSQPFCDGSHAGTS
ncbi:MAG: CDGSH iron-sulfur domain-containing protein, partial [Proteobacteria bacterium]|nr:CDGSH iron-sulfur domain-containing protein [Pseudomonadota bacterium]